MIFEVWTGRDLHRTVTHGSQMIDDMVSVSGSVKLVGKTFMLRLCLFYLEDWLTVDGILRSINMRLVSWTRA